MVKMNLRELRESGVEFLRNYFSRENMKFFNTNSRELQVYYSNKKYYIFDNIQYVDRYSDYIGNRTYCVKVYDVEANKTNYIVDHNADKETTLKEFKKILKEIK